MQKVLVLFMLMFFGCQEESVQRNKDSDPKKIKFYMTSLIDQQATILKNAELCKALYE